MARTRLFELLRRYARAHGFAQAERAESGAAASVGVHVTRRQLAEVGLGLLGAAVGCAPAAVVPTSTPQKVNAPLRVGVVGAGLAGLHAAYRLEQAGVAVRLFESSDRLGGRVFSGRGLFAEGQVCEFGGELVDSNHRCVHRLCNELGLHLDDRFKDLEAGYVQDTWHVAGKVVLEATLVAQFAEVAPRLASDLNSAESPEGFERLNQLTLSAYLNHAVPTEKYLELHRVLLAAYVGEFGLEADQQSALNLIYLLEADPALGFRPYGESDERYHVHAGNDQMASELAKRLRTPVQMGRRLVRAAGATGAYELTFDVGGTFVSERFQRVVFALPFSVLRLVDLRGLELSPLKRQIIAELGYGTNAKVMAGFSEAWWRTKYHASGALSSDSPLQQTWDSSIGQNGKSAILTNFLGGKQGVVCGQGSAEKWLLKQLPHLEQVFPGVSPLYAPGSAQRMHWPTVKHALGSYTCYRPGQWLFAGKEGLPEQGLHFAGEHTSAAFQGWMEGAVDSGARVALELLNAEQVPVPASLARYFDEKTALPGQVFAVPTQVEAS